VYHTNYFGQTQHSPWRSLFSNREIRQYRNRFNTSRQGEAGIACSGRISKPLTLPFHRQHLQGTITNALSIRNDKRASSHQITFTGNTFPERGPNIPDYALKLFLHKTNLVQCAHFLCGRPVERFRVGHQPEGSSGSKVSIDKPNGEGSGSSGNREGGLRCSFQKQGGSGASLDYRFTYARLESCKGQALHFHATAQVIRSPADTFTDSTSDGTWANVSPIVILTLMLHGKTMSYTSSVGAGRRKFAAHRRWWVCSLLYAKIQGNFYSSGTGTAWAALTNDLSRIQYTHVCQTWKYIYPVVHFHTKCECSVVRPFVFGTEIRHGWNGRN